MLGNARDDERAGESGKESLLKRLDRGFDKPALRGMLSVDAVLILISAICGILIVTQRISAWPDILNIGRDKSIAEFLNFAKWGVMIWVSWSAFRRSGHRILACLAIVFTLILLDDSLQLHEYTEEFLYHALQTPQNDLSFLGSIAFFALLGAVCLGILLPTWFRTPAHVRADIWPLSFLFGWLVFFGIGVDMLHGFATDRSLVAGALLLIEDGGEMAVISAMAAYVLGVFGSHSKDTQT